MFVAALIGAAVQGSVGAGLGLLLTPAVALAAPEMLPTVPILLGLPLTTALFLRERSHLETRGLGWLLFGHTLGAVVGAQVVSLAPPDARGIAAGLAVLAAVVVTLWRPGLSISTFTASVAGVTSGFMNTTAALAGPPVILLYRRSPGPVIRATTSAVFTLATLPSIVALAIAGEVRPQHLRMAGLLLPAIACGFLAARTAQRWIDRAFLYPAVLAVAALAGAVAVIQGVS